ncbi:MAG: MBL fold metallo-hydrolase [Shimia sp.]
MSAPTEIAPGLRRLRAPNPGPLTGTGTNTYLLGTGAATVIDPGPDDPAHLAAIRAACPVGIARVLVTHAHLDHAPLARRLGAPVLAFGPATAGRAPDMEALAAKGTLGGGEGIDADFAPDAALADGQAILVEGRPLEALHMPGHLSNHMCFAWDGWLFSGDHVMGWATTLVSPPDGDLTAFMASCRRLLDRPERRYLPGHGEPLADGPARTRALIAHREAREAQILEILGAGPATAAALVAAIYTDTPCALWPAAARNVLAHLIDLTRRGLAEPEGPLAADAIFARTR